MVPSCTRHLEGSQAQGGHSLLYHGDQETDNTQATEPVTQEVRVAESWGRGANQALRIPRACQEGSLEEAAPELYTEKGKIWGEQELKEPSKRRVSPAPPVLSLSLLVSVIIHCGTFTVYSLESAVQFPRPAPTLGSSHLLRHQIRLREERSPKVTQPGVPSPAQASSSHHLPLACSRRQRLEAAAPLPGPSASGAGWWARGSAPAHI